MATTHHRRHTHYMHHRWLIEQQKQHPPSARLLLNTATQATNCGHSHPLFKCSNLHIKVILLMMAMMIWTKMIGLNISSTTIRPQPLYQQLPINSLHNDDHQTRSNFMLMMMMMMITTTASSVIHPRRSSVVTVLPSLLLLASFVTPSPPPPSSSSSSSSSAIVEISKSSAAKFDFGQSSSSSSSTNNNAGGGAGTSIDGSIKEHGALSTTTNTASDSSDRWHTVSAYVGSELSLPCAVDVSGCGRIYFITWTKNVSTSMMGPILDSVSDNDQAQVDSSIMNNDNDQHHSSLHSSTPSSVSSVPNSNNNNNNKNGEWQRVFIHSDTFERVLGDLEQFGPKNRVHFGPENLSKTNFAHLTLRTVVPEDEGVYKCDVTYVTPHAHGKCPSLTYIRVQTLVKPSSPTIRINGKPLSEYRLDDTKGPNSSAKATLTSSSSSDIDLLRYNQIGPFEEGSTIVFECSTFGGRPMPELRWFNGSRPLRSKITVVDLDPTPDNSEQLDQQQQQQQPQPHSVNSEAKSKVLATTRIIASRYDLGAKFECRVLWNSSDFIGQNQPQQHHHNHLHHNASLLNDWLLLDIKVRPLSIRVDSPRSPVMAGETVLLRCTVDGARPPANITWYNRSEVVNAQPLPSLNHLIGVHNNNKQQQQQSSIHHSSSDNNGNIKIGAVGSLWGANQQPLQQQQQQQSQPRTRMTTELMTDGTYRSTSILAFVASRSDHQADFFCKGSNEILRNRNEVPLLQGVSLQVLYPPVVAIEPDGLIAVNESSTIQFWCTYDANPMNITEIRWYKNHRPIVLPEWSNENSKIWSALDERGTPTLTIKDIDRNDSAEYGCFIKNRLGASDSITTAKLEVAFPPVVVLEVIEPKNQIIEEHSNLPLPKLTLKCSTVMGNPPNLLAVHWYRNGHHFLTTVSFRHLQAQQQQQQQLQSNQVSTSTSSSIPSFFHHSFYHRIGTGKHFTLVDESTPLDGPVNGQFLLSSNGTYTEPYVHYLDEPELLIIANVTREHAGNYSCLGFNGASNASQLSEAKFVTVKYPPGPATLTLTPPNRFILKGAQALLECRIDDPGDPPAHTIIWTHNDIRIDRATTQFKSATDSSNKNPLVARYRTPKADMTTSGEYRCRALNDLGQGEWALFRLDVKSAPKLLEALPSTIGALSDQNLTLTCRVECQPPCEIHWFHNNLTKLSPDTRGILVSPLMTNEYRVKLRNGNELTFSVINEQTESLQGPAQTSSTLFIYNTSMLFDFDQLTCVSSNSDNEELGPPVYSSVIFRREYPPHSVHLSMPGIDLLEGEGYPEKPILCSAFGNPSPQYHWTFEPFLVTMTPGLMDHQSEPARKNQTVVAIGPRLNLDKSIAQGRIMLNKQQHDANEEMTSSTTVPGRFHASRTLSGNYTCVATNQHGSASAALTINVFYRPECELRRINTAKILRQQNHLHRQQPNDLHGTLEPQVPIMLSCTAISNPAPGKFSWYRRNGSELLEIHPSINSDHSLFVAISQDYDYASDGASEYFHHHHHHQNHPYMSDYVLPQSAMGHTRQSIVMGVPSDANLDEYACVVANAIGESSPCWYEESPTSDQMSATGRGNVSGDGDNLFMVAASAGLIVFCLVLFITVAIVFFLHRNRSTSSFKGFGSRGSDDATPQRFKMDRPHLLLDSSSSPEQLADVDFILDTRSKTATLTAGYRMTNAPCNQLSTPLITGTLSKPYHQRHIKNPYSTAGSVYANSDDLDATIKGLSSSRPYLVSCPSPNNPVYAEPEYHCLESSNPSGDGQLTGSTSVTTSSGANSNTSNVQLLPPLPPDVKMRFPMGKFNMNTNKQGNQIEMDAISNQEDGDDHGERNHDHPIDDNYDNYEEVKDPRPIIASRFSSNIRKKRRKRSNNNHTRNASSPMRSSSDYSKTSESEDSGDGLPANNDDNDMNREPESTECLANQLQQSQQRNKSDDQNYESYDDDDDDSSIPSTAYKPERDFFFINRQHQQISGFRNSASSNTGSSGSRRRLLPIANKYGSLIGNNHHHQPMMSSPRYVPQQYHQSPVSTRLYYNFDHPIMPSIPQHDDPSPNPLYNSLRFGNNHLRSNNCRNNNNNSAGAGLIRQHSAGSGSSSPPPLPPFPNDSSIRPSNSVYGRRSELNEQQSFQQQPPDYHQTILDQFYEQQTARKTNHDSDNNILHR